MSVNNTDSSSGASTVRHVIEARLLITETTEGPMALAMKAFRLTEQEVVQAALDYVLRELASGAPIGPDLHTTLSDQMQSKQATSEKLLSALSTTQAVIAQQTALVQAMTTLTKTITAHS